MNVKKSIICFCLLTSVIIFENSYSQTIEQKLKECSEITVSLIRLQCYDRLTQDSSIQTAQPVRERNGLFSRLGRSSSDDEINETSEEPVSSGQTTTVKTGNETTEDNFGLVIRDDKKRIQSRILGALNGWDGYTKFELDNGQIWQQSSFGVLRVKMNNPTIIIKKARMSDSYLLKVEGLNSSVRVKRIE